MKRKAMTREEEQALADTGGKRTYQMRGGTTLEVSGVKGFRLLKGDELREAAIAAGLIPKDDATGEPT